MAWLTAIFLHGLFAVLVFGALTGDGIRGAADPFGDGEAISVTLSGFEGGGATRAADTAAGSRDKALAMLAERLRSTTGVPATTRPADTAQTDNVAGLFAPGATGGPGRQGTGPDAVGRRADGGSALDTSRSSIRGDRGSSQSAGDFIGQIQACWSALPLRSTTPVTLEVIINDKGRLATKPTIVRAPGARLDEARLTAEATALTAIQTCLPAKTPPMPGLQASYRLTFDPARRRR